MNKYGKHSAEEFEVHPEVSDTIRRIKLELSSSFLVPTMTPERARQEKISTITTTNPPKINVYDNNLDLHGELQFNLEKLSTTLQIHLKGRKGTAFICGSG